MIKKLHSHYLGFLIAVFCVAGCSKDRNFYPDQYNPGLSRFTSRGYDIVSAYINDTAYVNPYISPNIGNSPVSIYIIHSAAAMDTLSISWAIEYGDSSIIYPLLYNSISLLMPISKSFSESDFLALQGERFPLDSTNNISIELNNNSGTNLLAGPAGIYFVQIDSVPNGGTTSPSQYTFSGLFDGNIGNNIQITKGRFDFFINPTDINY